MDNSSLCSFLPSIPPQIYLGPDFQGAASICHEHQTCVCLGAGPVWIRSQVCRNSKTNCPACKWLSPTTTSLDAATTETTLFPYWKKPHLRLCPMSLNQTTETSFTQWVWWRPLQGCDLSMILPDLHTPVPRILLWWPGKNHLGTLIHEVQISSQMCGSHLQVGGGKCRRFKNLGLGQFQIRVLQEILSCQLWGHCHQ